MLRDGLLAKEALVELLVVHPNCYLSFTDIFDGLSVLVFKGPLDWAFVLSRGNAWPVDDVKGAPDT